MNETELVRDFLGGNPASGRELVERYADFAMAVAMNVLMNREDAEDACQEAFFKAFQHLASFDQGRSFKPWFSALVYHQCFDQQRKKKNFRAFLSRFGKERPEEAATPPSDGAEAFPVESSFLRRLKPKERVALFLWAQEECSGEEIAAVLGCSRKTAYVHLYRARSRLKTIMKEERHGTPKTL